MEPQVARYRDITPGRMADHLALDRAERHFFPHRTRHLLRCGPDGLQLMSRMCPIRDPDALWEIAIHALPPVTDDFPEALFFDSDLVWHQRHLGLPGHIATATVALDGRTAWSVTYVSDIVQRSARRPEYRSRIDNRFKGWTLWALNAVLDFARERGCTTLRSPTADLVMRHTDPARTVQPEMYRRIYDTAVTRWFDATREGAWWHLDVARNARRIVRPEPATEPMSAERTICVCHDIERGMGHRGVDPALVARAGAEADRWLDEMLAVERAAGVQATYNVVARMLPDVRDRIEADGHALGFHSYDHSIDLWWPMSQWNRRLRRRLRPDVPADAGPIDQITGCREVDYRIRGYRPPQSRITRELNDRNLCWHNFEWLASSVHSLRVDTPTLRRRTVRLPILMDDYPLYRREASWEQWEAQALEQVAQRPFTALSLHDCYANLWLPHYATLLERLQRLGRLVTLDAVAARMFLTTAA